MFFGRLSSKAMGILERVGIVTRNPFMRQLTEEELADLAKDSEAIIVAMEPVSARVLEALDELRVVGKHGVGYENVDVKTATERGVVVTYTHQSNATSVAEHAFALILSLVRSIIPADSCVRGGGWGGPATLLLGSHRFLGVELDGKTIGIIGLGAIGSRVARIASGFGMKVAYYDHVRCHHLEKELEVRYYNNLHGLLRSCDFITIHVPLTPKTKHMIGAEELRCMKKTSFLVNTSRGGVVDEAALIEALKEKSIAGAALDVFEKEPVNVDNPLLRMENVIVTPHIAWFTREAVERMDITVANDVAAVLKGSKPMYIINPKVLSNGARERAKG